MESTILYNTKQQIEFRETQINELQSALDGVLDKDLNVMHKLLEELNGELFDIYSTKLFVLEESDLMTERDKFDEGFYIPYANSLEISARILTQEFIKNHNIILENVNDVNLKEKIEIVFRIALFDSVIKTSMENYPERKSILDDLYEERLKLYAENLGTDEIYGKIYNTSAKECNIVQKLYTTLSQQIFGNNTGVNENTFVTIAKNHLTNNNQSKSNDLFIEMVNGFEQSSMSELDSIRDEINQLDSDDTVDDFSEEFKKWLDKNKTRIENELSNNNEFSLINNRIENLMKTILEEGKALHPELTGKKDFGTQYDLNDLSQNLNSYYCLQDRIKRVQNNLNDIANPEEIASKKQRVSE